MTSTTDWTDNGIKSMLRGVLYANALCTCTDESSPCAVHAREAFDVWLCAMGCSTVETQGALRVRAPNPCQETDLARQYVVGHSFPEVWSADPGQAHSTPEVLRALYWGRIPWQIQMQPRRRDIIIHYADIGLGVGVRYAVVQNRHSWHMTHAVNTAYLQFVMGMLMPRPTRTGEAEQVAD